MKNEFTLGATTESFKREKCLTWTRVSTPEQEKGLDKQVESCEGLAQRLGFKKIDSYHSVSESAKSAGKEFKGMLKKLKDKRNGYDGLIVEYADRLSRNTPVGSKIIRQLRDLGIYFYTVREGINTEKTNDIFMCDWLFSRAEQENEFRKSKSVTSTRYWLEKGYWTATPPIGFVRENRFPKTDVRSKSLNHSEEAPLIKFGFDLYIKGYQIKEIAEITSKKGLWLNDKRWSEVLRNHLYAGFLKHKALGEGVIIKGKHLPIVPKRLFDKVQEKLGGHRKLKLVSSKEETILKGSLKCPKCSGNLTSYPKRKPNNPKIYHYYKCPKKGCGVNLTSSHVNDAFYDKLSKLKIDEKYVDFVHGVIKEVYNDTYDLENKIQPKLKEEKSKLEKRIEAIDDAFYDGHIEKVQRDKKVRKNELRISEIERELRDLDVICLDDFVNDIIHDLENLTEVWDDLEINEQMHLKSNLVENLVYDKEAKVIQMNGLLPLFKAS